MPQNKNVREYMNRIYEAKSKCVDNKTSYFVEHSEQSTTVTNERLDESQIIAIVMNDKDGPDSAYVFGSVNTDIQVGDYLTLKDSAQFLIYEKVRVIKTVDYNKFKAYECNVVVNDKFPAYFVGSKTNPKDINMSSGFETSKLLPMLVCPISAGIAIDAQISIAGQIWDVVELDNLSTPGIGYYTIERGTNTKSSQGAMPKDKANVLYRGTTFSITTEDGYYRSDTTLKVVSRTATLVTFEVPNAAAITVYGHKNAVEVAYTYTIKEHR